MAKNNKFIYKCIALITTICLGFSFTVFSSAQSGKCEPVTTTPSTTDTIFTGEYITLSTETPDATIYYAIDDENNGWTGWYALDGYKWLAYTGPIKMDCSPFILYTYCSKDGLADSDVKTYKFSSSVGACVLGNFENTTGAKTIIEVIDAQGKIARTNESANTSFITGKVASGTYTVKITKSCFVPVYIKNVDILKTDKDISAYLSGVYIPQGDVDCDENVTTSDASVVMSGTNYLKDVGVAENALSDVDGDGVVSTSDIAVILSNSNYLSSAVTVNE